MFAATGGDGGRRNFTDLVRRAAATVPDRLALAAGDARLTWRALDREVDAVAAGLAATGLVAGYRVATVLPNRVEHVTLTLGALRAGLVVVPVAPRSSRAAVEAVLRDSGPRLVVAEPTGLPAVRAAVAATHAGAHRPARPPRLAVVAGSRTGTGEGTGKGPAASAVQFDLTYAELVAAGAGTDVVTPQDSELLALLRPTAGTSGSPRLAMLDHRSLLDGLDRLAAVDPPAVRPDDVVFAAAPLSRPYGFTVFGAVARAGASLVLATEAETDPDAALRLVTEEGVTVVAATPALLSAWVGRRQVRGRAAVAGSDHLAARLGGVRLLLSAGGPLPARVAEPVRAATGLDVQQAYGVTEVATALTTTLSTPSPKPGSVGRPVPGTEVRVVTDAGDGELGEVQVRGPRTAVAYWPDGTGAAAGDWFATGDVGYVDDDGDLFLVDRLADVVTVSGFRVFPRQVAAVVAAMPQVADAAVVAGTGDDGAPELTAYVVAAAGARVTPAEVTDHCRGRLARFRCPTRVVVVPALPRPSTEAER